MKTLRLYGRPGCGLCEDMEEALYERFSGRFRMDWRDIDRDPVLRRRYGDRIPLLCSEKGEVLSVGTLDTDRLSAWLDAPRASV